MITIKRGNIFTSKSDVLVNTVNCVGVMGKGIALEYKKRFPNMYKEYRLKCKNNEIKIGKVYPYCENGKVRIINFPTKNHWKNLSKIEYITTGLDDFIDVYKKYGIKSVAFPALGCGNGGLDWKIVGPIIYSKLNNVDANIELYVPDKVDKKYIQEDFLLKKQSASTINKINDNWLLSLLVIKRLGETNHNVVVGKVMVQKIFYFLQYYGINMELHFIKGKYGPYSFEVEKIMDLFEINKLIIKETRGKTTRITAANNYIKNKRTYSDIEIKALEKTFCILQIAANSEEVEIISSMIYVYNELIKRDDKVDEEKIINSVIEWKGEYNNAGSKKYLKTIYKILSYHNSINNDHSN